MKHRYGFCDRCGQFTPLPETLKVCVCHRCEMGMNSIAAVIDQPWTRPITAAEIRLAYEWRQIKERIAV